MFLLYVCIFTWFGMCGITLTHTLEYVLLLLYSHLNTHAGAKLWHQLRCRMYPKYVFFIFSLLFLYISLSSFRVVFAQCHVISSLNSGRCCHDSKKWSLCQLLNNLNIFYDGLPACIVIGSQNVVGPLLWKFYNDMRLFWFIISLKISELSEVL